MATAEPADFVHVYDVKNEFEEEQEVDFFGEISGISFSPDTESLFIGVWDRTYGSLLQYSRSRRYSYLDSMLWSHSECIMPPQCIKELSKNVFVKKYGWGV